MTHRFVCCWILSALSVYPLEPVFQQAVCLWWMSPYHCQSDAASGCGSRMGNTLAMKKHDLQLRGRKYLSLCWVIDIILMLVRSNMSHIMAVLTLKQCVYSIDSSKCLIPFHYFICYTCTCMGCKPTHQVWLGQPYCWNFYAHKLKLN